MTRSEAKSILLNEFISNFDKTIPISYTNMSEFYLTTGVKVSKPTSSPWVRLFIQQDGTDWHTIGGEGGRRFERDGNINFQVFIPSGTGTSTGDAICEEIVDIFEGKRINSVVCLEGWWKEIKNNEADLFQFNGSINFTFDETK